MHKLILTWTPGECEYQMVHVSRDGGAFAAESDMIFQDEDEYPIYIEHGVRTVSAYIVSHLNGATATSESVTFEAAP